MYKIIINEQCLILCSTSELDRLNIEEENKLEVVFRGRKRQFFPFIDSMEKTRDNRVIVMHSDNLKTMFKLFISIFRVVKAAGGVVRNDQGKILFIYRRGHWDLPKGKIDNGEKKKEAAVREVCEETGIKELKLVDKIGKSYHFYRDKKNRRCLKFTNWYRMISNDINLVPQIEEDIEQAVWDDLSNVLKDSRPIYNSILELLKTESKMTSTMNKQFIRP